MQCSIDLVKKKKKTPSLEHFEDGRLLEIFRNRGCSLLKKKLIKGWVVLLDVYMK